MATEKHTPPPDSESTSPSADTEIETDANVAVARKSVSKGETDSKTTDTLLTEDNSKSQTKQAESDPELLDTPESTSKSDTELRTYLEIRPSTKALNVSAVAQAMELLYSRLEAATKSGLWNTLRGRAKAPLVEWLLVADGRSDTSIRYLVGTTDEAFLDDLEAICRTCLPNSYELMQVQWHPRCLEDALEATLDQPKSRPASSSRSSSEPTIDPDRDEDPPYVAGVEYRGHAHLGRDWLTSFKTFEEVLPTGMETAQPEQHTHESRRVPLATLIETLCEAAVPVMYQVICRPAGSVQSTADSYQIELEGGIVTTGDKIADFMFSGTEPKDPETVEPTPAYRDRLESLTRRDHRHPFQVSIRAVTLSRENPQRAKETAHQLSGAFDHLSGAFHEIYGHVVTDDDLHNQSLPPGSTIYKQLTDRVCNEITYDTLKNRPPWRAYESRGLVMSTAELPTVCLLDGVGLTGHGQRALEARHSERTGLPLPPPQILDRYSGVGQALCVPLTDDRQPHSQPFVLPPALQDRHLIVIGDTGSGKSVLTTTALLSNVEATTGPEILFDYKGGGTATELLEAHYARRGGLGDVQYFDLTKTLPALSIFTIRPLLEAGLSREEARSRIAGHYEEILSGLMGEEQYYSATESTKAIRNHLRALFDPIHGTETVSHKDLYDALQLTLSDRTPPSTSDERLSAYFAGLLERDRDVFNMVLGGAVARVETIATDDRLAPLFDHVYVPEEEETADAQIADRDAPQNQTDATRETTQTDRDDEDHRGHESVQTDVTNGEHTGDARETNELEPRVGREISIEDIGKSDEERDPYFDFTEIIDEDVIIVFDFGGMEERVKRALTMVLLSNLWIALKARTEESDGDETRESPQVNLYLEEAKDVATTQLVDTLLSQGRSFGLSLMLGVQFPGQLRSADPSNQTYEEALNEIGTFVVGNVSIEADLPKALATDDVPPEKVARRLAAMRHGEWLVRPAAEFGEPAPRPFLGRSLTPPAGHPVSDQPLEGKQYQSFKAAFDLMSIETWDNAGLAYESDPVLADQTDGTATDDETPEEDQSLRVDSLLPHSKRLPECVYYNEEIHALCCRSCRNRYDPTIEGIKRAITCCHTLEEVDPADIPVCEINLKLTTEEREESPWTDRQLLFLQTVYNAQQLRCDPLEYDLLRDSMIRLQEYVGIDTEAIAPLLEADVLRHDADHPHRLYSVSPEGRTVIGESYRQGVDYGHGEGDLEESSQHVFGIEVTRQYLEATYVDDPDSTVTEIIPYYDIDGNHRLDLAGVDGDGEIVITAEVERINNDVHRAVPADFDKMAACEPEEAIWIVMKQADGHKVLSALNNPPEGPPRVTKTYAKTTPPQQFRIDTPGLTAVYPAEWLRDQY
ncbi:hypothetical protein [Natronosalvus amylolyticus]|uniref:hypothetical protein n=1 Tax=Natronosalvus amylolyticus TaxID=2961994 RepID=UPI0020C94FC9|nr:hypothetical protein [Natronosalvus amylolyticus]